MHASLCQDLLGSLSSAGLEERHLRRLLAHQHHLHHSLKFALTLIALEAPAKVDLQALELATGGLAFQQSVDPLPLDVREWQLYVRQRNAKTRDHLKCTFDANKQDLFSDQALQEPLSPQVQRMFLVETAQASIRPEQAHLMLAEVAPHSAKLTRPILVFEVLRYFWDEINNLNAAYVMVNAPVRDVGYLVIFNSLSNGKRVTFVPGIPLQHAQYTGYYACCG